MPCPAPCTSMRNWARTSPAPLSTAVVAALVLSGCRSSRDRYDVQRPRSPRKPPLPLPLLPPSPPLPPEPPLEPPPAGETPVQDREPGWEHEGKLLGKYTPPGPPWPPPLEANARKSARARTWDKRARTCSHDLSMIAGQDARMYQESCAGKRLGSTGWSGSCQPLARDKVKRKNGGGDINEDKTHLDSPCARDKAANTVSKHASVVGWE